MNPLADGWLLVKDADNRMWWVHEEQGEIAEEPPNLNDLIDHFHNVKKKNQMMATRSEDDKQNARRKILGRNLAEQNESTQLPPPEKKMPASEQPRLKNDKTAPSKKEKKTPEQKKKNQAFQSPVPGKNKSNKMPIMDEVYEQTTDPKIKKGTMENSIGDLDMDFDGLDADLLDDDPYKYTKSTLKKGADDHSSPNPYAKRGRDNMTGEKAVLGDMPKNSGLGDFSIEHNRNDMPILEMDLDLGDDDDLGEPLQGDFITPSGKKNDRTVRNSSPKKPAQHNPPVRKEQSQETPVDNKYQMVDSSMLEKMISDINSMQMKVSQIEQENATLKRKNMEIVNDQKKFNQKTKTAIEGTKQEIDERLREKEAQIEDLLREELKKNSTADLAQSKVNLNILKDIQDMKSLLEQSVLKSVNAAQVEKKNDIQSSLPLADSQVFAQQTAPKQDPQGFQQSFGADFNKPPASPVNTDQNLGMNDHFDKFNSQVRDQDSRPGNFGMGYDAMNSNPAYGSFSGPKDSRVGYRTGQKGHGARNSGDASKWLSVIFSEKNQMNELKSRLQGLKLAIQGKAVIVAGFEQDMNSEMEKLALPHNHSLVYKLRSNIKLQTREYKSMVKEYENEKHKYYLRKNGINMLERTLLFVQNSGGINKQAEKHLEEVHSSFKFLNHFSKDDQNMDYSLSSNDSRSRSIDASHSLDMRDQRVAASNYQSQNIIVEDAQILMQKKSEPTNEVGEDNQIESMQQMEEIVNPGVESIAVEPQIKNDLPPSRASSQNKSRNMQKDAFNSKGSYFNESKRLASYLGKTNTSMNLEPNYAKIRDSLGYYPTSKMQYNDSASDNMKRYFQTQAKWYSDMRSEVAYL